MAKKKIKFTAWVVRDSSDDMGMWTVEDARCELKATGEGLLGLYPTKKAATTFRESQVPVKVEIKEL